MKLSFLIFLAIVGFAACASIPRNIDEIESFRKFLESSVHGKYQEPINEELRDLQNEWERSGKFEGDIVLNKEQRKAFVNDYAGVESRNALLNNALLWPDKIVYYNISDSGFTPAQVQAIEEGVKNLGDISCLTFKKSNASTPGYITVEGGSGGCFSSVGYQGRAQVLNLAPYEVGTGCFRHGTIVHEFLHAIGFYHMQSTHDRDDFVKIVWEKIQTGTEHNFNKYTNQTVSNLGVTYDYGSVLHYSEYGFSVDGNRTIVPIKETDKIIGQRYGMSAEDIIKLNKLYNCPGF